MLVITRFTQLRDSTMLDRDLVFINYLKSFTGKSLLTIIALQACLFVLGSYWQRHSYFVMLFILFYLVFSLYTWMIARYWAYRLKFHGLAINLLVISDVAFILLLLSLQWLETLAGFDVPFDSILEFSIYELKRHRCL